MDSDPHALTQDDLNNLFQDLMPPSVEIPADENPPDSPQEPPQSPPTIHSPASYTPPNDLEDPLEAAPTPGSARHAARMRTLTLHLRDAMSRVLTLWGQAEKELRLYAGEPTPGDYTDTPDRKRFWAKVHQNGQHWLWTGAVNSKGQGVLLWPRDGQLVQRPAAHIAWEIEHPEHLLAKSQRMSPACQAPRCVRCWRPMQPLPLAASPQETTDALEEELPTWATLSTPAPIARAPAQRNPGRPSSKILPTCIRGHQRVRDAKGRSVCRECDALRAKERRWRADISDA